MEVTKVRRKSSYPMGTTKYMGVRRTGRTHGWGSFSGHVDDRCGKLIRCMRRNIINSRGRLLIEPKHMYGFITPVPKDYCLVPGNGAIQLVD